MVRPSFPGVSGRTEVSDGWTKTVNATPNTEVANGVGIISSETLAPAPTIVVAGIPGKIMIVITVTGGEDAGIVDAEMMIWLPGADTFATSRLGQAGMLRPWSRVLLQDTRSVVLMRGGPVTCGGPAIWYCWSTWYGTLTWYCTATWYCAAFRCGELTAAGWCGGGVCTAGILMDAAPPYAVVGTFADDPPCVQMDDTPSATMSKFSLPVGGPIGAMIDPALDVRAGANTVAVA